jgi:peptide/nickel transport system substrate-binding protein
MKRMIALITVLTLLTTAFAGCGGSGGETGSDRKQLVVATALDWEGTDCYQVNVVQTEQTIMADSLLCLNSKTKELQPNIASSFEVSEDGRTIKLTVPEDITYADGTPLTPDDVKRSIEWGFEISPYSSDYASIREVSVEGDQVIISLDNYSATVMYYLTSFFMPVMSREQIENTSAQDLLMGASPYGLFSVDEYVAASHVRLTRNDGYKTNNPEAANKGASLIDEVLVKIMPDGFSRITAIKSGEADIVVDIPTQNYEELKNDPDIELIASEAPGLQFLTLNKDNPLFADIRIRTAIAYALDRERLIEANKGFIKPAYSFVTSSMLDYDQEIADYYKTAYCDKLDQAKQILKDAGWADTDGDGYLDKDGKAFEFTTTAVSTSVFAKNVAQIMQANLKEIGIKLNIEMMEQGYLREKETQDEYDAALDGFEWPEPMSILPYIVRDSDNIEHEEFFDMIVKAGGIADNGARAKAVGEAQKVLMDEVAFIPLYSESRLSAVRKNVTGLYFVDGIPVFNNVDKN